MVDFKSLGGRIKKVRTARALTQKYLAEKIECTTGFIADIETGRGKPSIETIVKIANILEISLDKLFYDSLNKILIDNTVSSKVMYDKEIKELISDLNQHELKLMIEVMKFQKEIIRKSSQTENIETSKKIKKSPK